MRCPKCGGEADDKNSTGGHICYKTAQVRSVPLQTIPIEKYEQLQAELEKHRWIPVSERLPEGSHSVLIYCDRMITTGYFDNFEGRAEWQIHCNTPRCYYQEKITHWKPITQPKEDENGPQT